MRTIFLRCYLCLLISISAAFPASSQFHQVYLDSYSDNAVSKVSFYSPSQGFVAFKDWLGFTSDSGHTYIKKSITTRNVDYNGNSVSLTFGFGINGAKAFDQNTVIAYGDYDYMPAILYSKDGGNSFKLVFYNNYNPVQIHDGITDMVFPPNSDTGYATDPFQILKTTDKGVTWTPVLNSTYLTFDHLVVIDANHIFAYTTQYNQQAMLKSGDGGLTWQQIRLPAGERASGVDFISARNGWLTTLNGTVYSTIDSGASWQARNKGSVNPSGVNKIHFVNDSTGYGLGPLFQVYKTVDSGKFWDPLPGDGYQFQLNSYNDFQFWNQNQIWAGGAHGYLALTTNGGGTPSNAPHAYFDIDTTGSYNSGTVNLINYSKSGFNYKWLVNSVPLTNAFNTSYRHNFRNVTDTITLIVSNGQGTDTSQKIQNFYLPVLPQLTSFTPATASKGSLITIRGIHLTSVMAVSFGGVPADSLMIRSDTLIQTTVGSGASGSITLTSHFIDLSWPGFIYNAPPSALPPSVTSFSPMSGPVGTVLTINGNHFNTDPTSNIVSIGSIKAQVTAASGTQLTCVVPASAGYQPITVLDASTGLSGASARPFNLTFADTSNFTGHSFGAGYMLSFSANATSSLDVKGADLDGDGKPDLVASAAGYVDSLSVARNTTTGNSLSFTKPQTLSPLGKNSSSQLGIGDMDGDGRLDIIGNMNDGSVTVFRNSSTMGSISVEAPLSVQVSDGSQQSAIADLDGDGRSDLAVACYNNSKISVVRNTSSPGHLSFSVNHDYPAGANAESIATADLDGDGRIDIVCVNGSAQTFSSNFSCYRNKSVVGNIVLDTAINIALPGAALNGPTVSLADFDGDNKPDVIILNDNNYLLFRNRSTPGNILFDRPVIYPLTNFGLGGSIGNLNGDGRPDLVQGIWSERAIVLYRNLSVPDTLRLDRPLSFTNPAGITVSAANTDCVDFNGDGKPDIVVSGGNYVVVYPNKVGLPVDFKVCINSGSKLDADLTGTTFQWQQDSGSGFSNITDNGNVYGSTKNELTFSSIPSSWDGYKFRCLVDGLSSSIFRMHVNSPVSPKVIMTTSDTTICAGQRAYFTASGSNYGPTPLYIWQVNGRTMGSNLDTFSTNTLQNGDRVRVILISGDVCSSGATDTSASTIAVKGPMPTATIATTTATICSGALTTFTTSVTNAGTHPSFNWQLNGVHVGSDTSALSYSHFKNGDRLSVLVTGNECAVPVTFYSSILTLNVRDSIVPSVTLIVNKPSICVGDYANFVGSFSDGGMVPDFTWWKNGTIVGVNSSTYATNDLHDHDSIYVAIKNRAACAATDTAKSNTITMTVSPHLAPDITISGTTVVNVGQSTLITTAIHNGGNSPVYNWQDSLGALGWEDVHLSYSTLNYTPLVNGAKLRCWLQSTATCAAPADTVSNTLTFSLNTPTAVSAVPATSYGIQNYPNPVRNIWTIANLKPNDHWQRLKILSIDGRQQLVLEDINGRSAVTVNVTTLPSGVYIAYLVNMTGQVVCFKFEKL